MKTNRQHSQQQPWRNPVLYRLWWKMELHLELTNQHLYN